MKLNNEKERLLCYAAGILGARISNPNNVYSVEGLIPSCIREAKMLIELVYKDGESDERSN
jgi:hypothetical protein